MKGNVIVGQSGGPTAAINSSLAGVYRTAIERGAKKVYGMRNGIQGLLEERYVDLSEHITNDLDVELLKRTPAAYLGSCRYKLPEIHEDQSVYEKIFGILEKLEIEAFIYIGGNDSMDTIKKLSDYGILTGKQCKFVGAPKTIDNDLWGTEMTFGFQSAVDIATDTIDRIHTTASSHSRVFIIEVMGHKVGHVTLQSGIAGGADVILLPEIPYDIDKVAEVVENRFAAGKKFSIIAVAEGAISKEDAKLKKKQYKAKLAERRYPSVAYEIAAALEEKTNREIRVTVPGHTQRGGAPCAYDRVLATRVGAYAAELILNKEYGYMVGIVDGDTKKVPLSEVAGKLKYVDPKCQMIKDAKTIGISFGE